MYVPPLMALVFPKALVLSVPTTAPLFVAVAPGVVNLSLPEAVFPITVLSIP